MSKSFLLLILLTFFHITSNGEKNCKDIWSMDNSINGVTLYKVTINMCTEGIFVPDNLEETTTPAISFVDYNITNTSTCIVQTCYSFLINVFVSLQSSTSTKVLSNLSFVRVSCLTGDFVICCSKIKFALIRRFIQIMLSQVGFRRLL